MSEHTTRFSQVKHQSTSIVDSWRYRKKKRSFATFKNAPESLFRAAEGIDQDLVCGCQTCHNITVVGVPRVHAEKGCFYPATGQNNYTFSVSEKCSSFLVSYDTQDKTHVRGIQVPFSRRVHSASRQ